MSLTNCEQILEALEDVASLQDGPAKPEDILRYLCFAHSGAAAGLKNALKASLEVGVLYGYIDKTDDNCYVASNLDFECNIDDSAGSLVDDRPTSSKKMPNQDTNSIPGNLTQLNLSTMPSSSQGIELKRRRQLRRKRGTTKINRNRRVTKGKGRRGRNRSKGQRRQPRRR